MPNRGIAQRTLADVSYSGSGGVGDCPRLIPTLGDPWETAGPRIDKIPLARPPWWRRQYRELKKLFFSAPSECPIDLLGPLSNRTILKRLHARSDLLASVLHAASLQRFWTYFALNHDRDRFRDARSHKKAAHWWKLAARQGDLKAKEMLPTVQEMLDKEQKKPIKKFQPMTIADAQNICQNTKSSFCN